MFSTTFEDLSKIISEYYRKRGLKYPNGKDAAIWLATEVGELLDALMRQESGWVRNNSKDVDPAVELADCLMMVLVCGRALGVDPVEVLQQKMERKLRQSMDKR